MITRPTPSSRPSGGRTSRLLPVLALLLAAVVSLAACSGSDAPGDSPGDASGTPAVAASADASEGGGDGGGADQADSFLAAWPTAQEAMAQVADDAVLLSVGTGGLALADVPSSWSFVFFSPGTKHVYSVAVDHGDAGEAQDLGAATSDTEVGAALDVESIEVGAAEAVALAREFGEQSGAVPANVMVGGAFADLPGAADLDIRSGVWTVTFATGTDLADAQKYDVDMMTGEVTAAKD
jgi:hypothetical protein